jgi:hypothetical protein
MRRRIAPLTLIVIAAVGACWMRRPTFAEGGVAPARWCVPDTGTFRGLAVSTLRATLSARDSVAIRGRASLADLPYVPPEEVYVVEDEGLCERASRALAAQLFPRDPQGVPHLEPVRLFRAGARWVAIPRDSRAGEFGFAVHLDSHFKKLVVSTI